MDELEVLTFGVRQQHASPGGVQSVRRERHQSLAEARSVEVVVERICGCEQRALLEHLPIQLGNASF